MLLDLHQLHVVVNLTFQSGYCMIHLNTAKAQHTVTLAMSDSVPEGGSSYRFHTKL